ncbi:MAG: ABC transporter ATP-binding protein [Chloroflexi bacterium]|nr:ABC transporter ATP-binding protein [Chloroflexota bacterium]
MWAGHGGAWGAGWHAHHGGLDDESHGQLYNHEVVRRLLPYFRSHLGLVLVALAMMLLYTGTQVAIPWLVGHIIDSLLIPGGGNLAGLSRAAVLLLLVVGANLVGNYTYLRTLGKVSQDVLYRLRTGMFDHLQRLSVPFFDKNEAGRVMSRVQNDVNQLQDFLPVVTLTLGDLLSLVGIVVVMLLMDVRLALVTFTVIPVLGAILLVWQRSARVAFIRVRRAISVVNSRLQQNISGVRVVQSLNREDVNLQEFDEVNYGHMSANLSAIRLAAFLMPVVELLTAAGLALVVVVGGMMVLDGDLLPGALVAFALYVQRFFEPVRSLTQQYTQFQRAMTSGVRIFQLLDVQPEVVERPGARELPLLRGEVRYEGVGFEYVPDVPVLQDVDLHLKPGQKVALVGPTGAGKSTMAALLARFYDPARGRITVDGNDLREVTRASYARQLGMVLQEPFLFSLSVAENIRYRHKEATLEEVMEAARAVGAHDFILRLEQGYHTMLRERGGNLSMGQRQLISFARAVLANPRILVLDEATANIDSFTEAMIQRALGRLLAHRTALIIAHRLSTVRNADLIVVLDQGRITDMGTHEELLGRCALYARLYTLNFQDTEDRPAAPALLQDGRAPEERPGKVRSPTRESGLPD